MSRREKALIAAAFSYAQTIAGILLSLYVTRLLIRDLGKDLYGVWLASGALFAYAGLADLGIFGVFPWLIAEADGARDTAKMKRVIANGFVLGAIGGVVYLVVCAALWFAFPSVLHLTSSDRAQLAEPLLLLALGTAVSFPLRLFSALQVGLQDYRVMGAIGVMQTLLGGLTTIVLVKMGYGLYGVSIGAVLPVLFSSAAGFVRTRVKNRELLSGWPRPNWTETKPLLSSGLGQWMGTLGWQMSFATDAVLIAFLGARDSVPLFVVTSRLGLTLMQFGWTVPDAALVGLAQLKAEGNDKRTDEVVEMLIRINLLVAGGIAIGLLAFNGAFVENWVGLDLFGGTKLNTAFALDILLLSLSHAIVTTSAVLGRRFEIGLLAVVNGIVHLGLGLGLGRILGLLGVALATFASGLLTSVPGAFKMLTSQTGLKPARLARLFQEWFVRIVPCAAATLFAGHWLLYSWHGTKQLFLLIASLVAAIFVLVYARISRSLWSDFPLGERARRILVALRLT